jgi:hypothetical protein
MNFENQNNVNIIIEGESDEQKTTEGSGRSCDADAVGLVIGL